MAEENKMTGELLAVAGESKGKVLMKWIAKEYHDNKKPAWWYWGAGVFGILLCIYSAFTANYLLILIVVLLTVIMGVYQRRQPIDINITISDTGMGVGSKFYSFADDLSSFWILYELPDLKMLHLARRSMLPELMIPFDAENPLKIREILMKYLPEDVTKEEHGADRIARRIGF